MTVISVENLGKKYTISHQQRGDNSSLREVITNSVASFTKKLLSPFTPHPSQASPHPSPFTFHDSPASEDFWALKDVSFEVKQGERIGIIGRNGAGKSTLLKILSRITEPTTGRVKIKGRVASLLEVGTGFHPELTGRENIYLNGAILGMGRQEINRKFDEIVAFSEIERFLDTPVKRYSSGMYVRLAFAVAAHLEPEILIVDEVLAVGDASFQKKCLGKMEEVGSEGRTVLFVSHNMGAIKYLCGSVLLLDKGTIKSVGKPESVIAHYLGLDSNTNDNGCLELVSERSGNGVVIFSEFFIEDKHGNRITKVLTGEDVVFVFRVKASYANSGKVDLGFSLHNPLGDVFSVLYSSYQNSLFEINDSGYGYIRCILENFPFPSGRLLVKGRLLVDGEESDWPKVPIGSVDIEKGDFFGTGNQGFPGNVSFLVKGHWKYND